MLLIKQIITNKEEKTVIINQQNLKDLFINFNAIFNKTLEETEQNYLKVAMEVPSASSDENYVWFGQIPSMREWIGDRQIQNLSAHTYTIKNKDFELTIAVNRNDIADDKIGVYANSGHGSNGRRHPDELVFTLLGQGFENKCYDGKTFFQKTIH